MAIADALAVAVAVVLEVSALRTKQPSQTQQPLAQLQESSAAATAAVLLVTVVMTAVMAAVLGAVAAAIGPTVSALRVIPPLQTQLHLVVL